MKRSSTRGTCVRARSLIYELYIWILSTIALDYKLNASKFEISLSQRYFSYSVIIVTLALLRFDTREFKEGANKGLLYCFSYHSLFY